MSLGRLYPSASELDQGLVVTATELTTDEDIERLAQGLAEELA